MLILSIVVAALIVLYAIGVHVAAVLGIITLGLMTFFSDRPMTEMTGLLAWNVGTTNVLVAVPMFILMGELLLRGGLTERMYRCFAAWFRWLPGGLMQANIATCAVFAAMSGSTAATAATISRVALPAFRARGYNEPLVVGSLAAGGTLGILIPPSIILIVYGVLAEESIGALRNLAGAFQFSGEDVDKKIRALSGGEKTRLVLARMLLNPPNFLVLDEPTNHLDLATKEMLLEALKDFDGTMLFVSHDRAFLRALSNRVIELGGESGTEAEPHLYPGSYVEYVERTGHEAPGVHA